jgi:hypothetical protein
VLGPVLFFLIGLVGDDSRRWFEDSGLTLHAVYRDSVKTWAYRFDREAAEAYLVELVADVLNQATTAWLPFDVVTDRKRSVQPHKMPEGDVRDMLRRQFAAELDEAVTEETRYLVRMTNPTVPEDALDKVRRRFKIFFDRKET